MPKADPVVYTPLDHVVVHFGSPVGTQYTKPKIKPAENAAETEEEAK